MTENQPPTDPHEPTDDWAAPAEDWAAPQGDSAADDAPEADRATSDMPMNDTSTDDWAAPMDATADDSSTDDSPTDDSPTDDIGAGNDDRDDDRDDGGDDPIQPPPHVAGPPPVRRLRRTSTSSGPGVAGGIARYLGVESGLIKAAFIIASFVGGLGIFAYVAAWALIPSDTHPDQRPVVLNGGVAPIVVGTLALAAAASTVFSPGALVGSLLGPALLIGLGFYVLDQRSVPQVVTHQPGAPQPTANQAATYQPAANQPGATQGEPMTSASTSTRPSWIPPLTTTPAAAPPPPAPDQQPVWGAIHTEAAPVVETAPRPPVTAVTLAAVAVVTGVLLAVDQFFDVDVTATQYFGAALGLIVVGLVVSLFIGRAIGLWFAGLIALIGVLVSPIAISMSVNGVGSETVTVVAASELEPSYSLGVGELILDLRNLDLEQDAATALDIRAGEIVVYLPEGDDVTVDLVAEADFGDVKIVEPAFTNSSIRVERDRSTAGGRVAERFEGREGSPVLTLRADARFGSIEVRR